MKFDSLKTTLRLLAITGSLLSVPAISNAQNTYHVTVNTATLEGNVNAPFYLDFQMNFGSGPTGDSGVISNFVYTGGGAATGTPNLIGNASGDIGSTVALSSTPTSFNNELFQTFTPGATLSFDVSLTNNPTGAVPDDLEFAILDKTQGQIPTTQPTGTNDPQNGIDGLSLIDFEIGGQGLVNQQIRANAYNGANNPDLGGDYTGVTVTVTATPEPASWALAVVCAGLFAGLRRRSVRA